MCRVGLIPCGRFDKFVVVTEATVERIKNEGIKFKPKRDPLIPKLVMTRGAANLRGVSPQRMSTLYLEGQAAGAKAGPNTLFQPKTIKKLDKGLPEKIGAPVRDEEIPDLVTVAEAADMLGVRRIDVVDLYHGGWLPGVEVETGDDNNTTRLLFRRQAVEEARDVKPEPAIDRKIPKLVAVGGAGKLIGGTADTARNRYLAGHLPGRAVIGGGGPAYVAFREDTAKQHGKTWTPKAG
jgi:hypothetical protein